MHDSQTNIHRGMVDVEDDDIIVELRDDLGASVMLSEAVETSPTKSSCSSSSSKKKKTKDPTDGSSRDSNSVIRHLVLSGGGTSGLVAFGALRASQQQQPQPLWSHDDIVSIDAVSAGTILAILIALRFDWDDAETYLVKRPWHHVIKSDLYGMLGAFERRGMWGQEIFEELLSPLLLAKNLDKTSTLDDLHRVSGIDVHLYTVAMKERCELVDLSHRTHPTWTIIEAVYASSCVPVLFAPLFKDGIGYVDGGILLNYPLPKCLERPTTGHGDTILGINKQLDDTEPMQSTSTLFDTLTYLITHIIMSSRHRIPLPSLRHEFHITSGLVTSLDILHLCSSESLRQTLVDEGKAIASSSKKN